jgi:serine/threonine protein kinase
MNPATAERAAIFVDVLLDLPESRRTDAARALCGADDALYALVEQALSSAEQEVLLQRVRSDSRPPDPTSIHATDTSDAASRAGLGSEQLGPYTLGERLGEGGFGVVFAAEQAGAIRRRVAIKIMKEGMDSRNVIARFQAERQALAMMDHPNISRVFDAGTTRDGRPYFVMELVEGVTITRYCEDNGLTPATASSCSSRSARRSTTRTRRASSIATSSPAM